MQRYQRCSFLSLPTSPSLPLSFSLTRSFLSFLPHRLFTQSSRATGALRGNTDPAKEFIEFVVQLIPRRQAGVESGIGGAVWKGSGEQGGRVNVKGSQLHQGSLIENNTAKSLLDQILFKFTRPSPTYLPLLQCRWNERHLLFLTFIYFTRDQNLRRYPGIDLRIQTVHRDSGIQLTLLYR